MASTHWPHVKDVFHRALDVPPADRAAFLARVCAGDDDLRREVESLLSAERASGDFLNAPPRVDPGVVAAAVGAVGRDDDRTARAGERVGNYEIIRELGRGGMGAVYLAERADAEFDKRVAIKLVNRGLDSDLLQRRFVAERQILANLEHPNIARFLDGGTTADGVPYFVMEYVEGEPITTYSDWHQLDTTARLRLFLRVAAAVQHAHQHLIVHRDLKPSNIIVTAEGVPKLLDFGIARLIKPDWEPEATIDTAGAWRIMTPEYASPEQLRGLPATTAADVYSLGVVLYELLSGRHPFAFRSRLPEEIVEVLLNEEPTRPSTAAGTRSGDASTRKSRRRLLGDLDNIVMMAIRRDRERRYASVQAFSEDIERHLAGLPVRAHDDTFAYRAGKLLRRHRAGAIATSLVALTLVSATMLTARAAQVARRESDLATRRLVEVRTLSNSLLMDAAISLRDLRGTAPTQRLLVTRSLEALEHLVRDDDRDVVLLGELAGAYDRARSLQLVSLRDAQTSLASAERAVALYRRRVALAPADPKMKAQLAGGLGGLMETLGSLGRAADRNAANAEMIGLFESLLAADPDNTAYMKSLASCRDSEAESVWTTRPDAARADLRAAADLLARAIPADADAATTPQARVDVATIRQMRGEDLRRLGDFEHAANSYRAASQTADAVYLEHPELVMALRAAASSRRGLADVLDESGDARGALAGYQAALGLMQAGYARDPAMDSLQYGDIKYSILVGIALKQVGRTAEAIRVVQRAMRLYRYIVVIDKGNASVQFYSYETSLKAAEFFTTVGRREEAIEIYMESARWIDGLEAQGLADGPLLASQAGYYAKVNELCAATPRKPLACAEALARFRKQ